MERYITELQVREDWSSFEMAAVDEWCTKRNGRRVDHCNWRHWGGDLHAHGFHLQKRTATFHIQRVSKFALWRLPETKTKPQEKLNICKTSNSTYRTHRFWKQKVWWWRSKAAAAGRHFCMWSRRQDFIRIKVGMAEGHTTLEIMNWLFTSLDVAPGSTHIPFSKQEDPHGDMEGAHGSDLIRAEDNVVDYFVKDTKLASSSAERSVHMRECTHWPKQRKQRIQQCNASQAYYIPSRRYGWGWIFGRSFTGQTQAIPAQTRYSIHTTGGYITHPGQCQHNHWWAELTIKQNAINKKRAAAPDTVKYKRRVNFEIVNETVKRRRTEDHSINAGASTDVAEGAVQ